MLPAQQTGQDGLGQKYVLTKLPSIRLKSKPVTAIRSTTLKIEGTMSGATYTMAVTVKPGDAVLEFYPPRRSRSTKWSSCQFYSSNYRFGVLIWDI